MESKGATRIRAPTFWPGLFLLDYIYRRAACVLLCAQLGRPVKGPAEIQSEQGRTFEEGLARAMMWFGQSWGAPVCDPDELVAMPTGKLCAQCAVAITEHDQGVCLVHCAQAGLQLHPWHLDCFLMSLGLTNETSRVITAEPKREEST